MSEERYNLDIQTLKQQTEADHRSAEEELPLMQPNLNIATYVDCLSKWHGVIAAWEEQASSFAPDWLLPFLIARRRRPLLALDLKWFGVVASHERRTLPGIGDLPSLLGAMYVIEGSSLGGQIIARHVETALMLRPGHGNSFFRGHGSQTGPLWKEFCEMMETRVPNDQADAVIASAKRMFATFRLWMQEKSVADGS
jgi:heme oxygenase